MKHFKNLCILLIFVWAGTFLFTAVDPVKTEYPYSETGVIIGYSGVYEFFIDNRLWGDEDQTAKETVTNWLDKIAGNGGNVVRFFAYGNWKPTPNPNFIRPWKYNDEYEKYELDDWNQKYWTRLENLMEELRKRNLTAWIDIWDWCSIKGDRYDSHPFNGDNNCNWEWTDSKYFSITEDDSEYSTYQIIREARRRFERKIIETTIDYNPIISSNEIAAWNDINFHTDMTDYWIELGIPVEMISHSPSNDSTKTYLKNQYNNLLLLAAHGKSTPGEIESNEQYFKDHGIKVISSDGETDGAVNQNGEYPHWGTKSPLSADEAGESMRRAINLGFKGLEILDRDEYKISWDANLSYIDTATLIKMVEAMKEFKITFVQPKYGFQVPKGIKYEITYELPCDPGGHLKVLLHGPTSGVIRNMIDSEYGKPESEGPPDWSWMVDKLLDGTPIEPGNGYQIELISIENPSINGISEPFSITESIQGNIEITAPTEGEEIGIGTEYRKVRWVPPVVSLPPGTADDLRMILLKNGAIYKSGTIYEFVGNDGDKTWYVGNLLDGQPIETGTGYQIKLEVKHDTNYVGFSPPFSIVSYATPPIQITSPNGGEALTLGENYTFTWSTNGFPVSENIGLKIVKNDVDLGYIAADIPNTGSYDMALSTLTDGQAIEPGNDYKIEVRVMDTSNGIFKDRSDQNFTISADESICTETWQPANSPITYWIGDVIFVNDVFTAAAGGMIILTSVDGINWNSINTGIDGNNLAITYGNNQYVVTGTYGLVLTSPDGTTWTQQTSGVLVKLRDVIWANSLYIAVGFEGTILTSPDGITWTAQTSGTPNRLYNIAYGNNTYVVVGEAGLVLVSPDGVTWSEANPGISANLLQVAYLNGQFFALGQTGIILTSPDGINWTSHTSGTSEALYGITYELSRYVVTGTAGTILTSPDGLTWTAQDSGITTQLLWGIAYGNGKLVVAGADGIILYSECPSTTPSISVMSPNGGEDLEIGSTYTVTWNTFGITENIKINLHKGDQWYGNIVRDIPADQGSYNWAVGSLSNGETAPAGTDYKILVRTMDSGPYDLSDGDFTISSDPTIEVLSPNGGETFYRHNNLTVSWVSSQTGNVNINLLQNGTVLGRIASDVANSGSYTWEIEQLENGVIPDYASNYQVQIETVSGTSDDTSDANFTIAKPFITFQKPAGGNTFTYGSKIYINWTTTGINKGSITLYMNRYTSTERYKIATYLFDKGATTYTVETSIPADYYKIKGIWTVDNSVYSKSGKFLVTE